jgi:hypothetical protein
MQKICTRCVSTGSPPSEARARKALVSQKLVVLRPFKPNNLSTSTWLSGSLSSHLSVQTTGPISPSHKVPFCYYNIAIENPWQRHNTIVAYAKDLNQSAQ